MGGAGVRGVGSSARTRPTSGGDGVALPGRCRRARRLHRRRRRGRLVWRRRRWLASGGNGCGGRRWRQQLRQPPRHRRHLWLTVVSPAPSAAGRSRSPSCTTRSPPRPLPPQWSPTRRNVDRHRHGQRQQHRHPTGNVHVRGLRAVPNRRPAAPRERPAPDSARLRRAAAQQRRQPHRLGHVVGLDSREPPRLRTASSPPIPATPTTTRRPTPGRTACFIGPGPSSTSDVLADAVDDPARRHDQRHGRRTHGRRRSRRPARSRSPYAGQRSIATACTSGGTSDGSSPVQTISASPGRPRTRVHPDGARRRGASAPTTGGDPVYLTSSDSDGAGDNCVTVTPADSSTTSTPASSSIQLGDSTGDRVVVTRQPGRRHAVRAGRVLGVRSAAAPASADAPPAGTSLGGPPHSVGRLGLRQPANFTPPALWHVLLPRRPSRSGGNYLASSDGTSAASASRSRRLTAPPAPRPLTSIDLSVGAVTSDSSDR